jgi:hypothetical protein
MILDTNRQALIDRRACPRENGERLSYGRDGFRIFTYTSTLHLFFITYHSLLITDFYARYSIHNTRYEKVILIFIF